MGNENAMQEGRQSEWKDRASRWKRSEEEVKRKDRANKSDRWNN